MLGVVTATDPAAAGGVVPQTKSKAGQPVRTAAFFDLDKTVIAKSSTLAFSKPFYDQGLINRRTVLKSAYAQFLFLMSGADHDQMDRMRNYITNMCAGWDVGTDQVDRRRNAARHRRPSGLRRGRQPDRRSQAVRARRRRRVGVGRGDRRPDRQSARRHPRDGHPDGRRGRKVHRRGRLLLLRRGQGTRRFTSSPLARGTRSSTVTPTPTRSPICRCSKRSVIRPW